MISRSIRISSFKNYESRDGSIQIIKWHKDQSQKREKVNTDMRIEERRAAGGPKEEVKRGTTRVVRGRDEMTKNNST